jgi:GNAT superfamily N-acetyltransferase
MDLAPPIFPLDATAAEARLDELAGLLVDAVASGGSVNFLAGLDRDAARAWWRRAALPGLATGERVVLVAEADGRLVGTVQVAFATQPNQPHRADVAKMLVHSSARGRGLGARLLAAAEAAALAHGRTLVTLDTETGSAGERLYRRGGWTAIGAIPGYALTTDGRPAAATFFYKELRPD